MHKNCGKHLLYSAVLGWRDGACIAKHLIREVLKLWSPVAVEDLHSYHCTLEYNEKDLMLC